MKLYRSSKLNIVPRVVIYWCEGEKLAGPIQFNPDIEDGLMEKLVQKGNWKHDTWIEDVSFTVIPTFRFEY